MPANAPGPTPVGVAADAAAEPGVRPDPRGTS